MSEVNSNDLRPIKSSEDIFDLYLGAKNNAKAGIEVELAFFNPANNAPMSIPQNRVLKNAALEKLPGDWVRNEPTSETLEVNSIAGTAFEIKDVLEDTQNKIQILTEQATKLGLKRSFFQELPHKTADELLEKIVNIDRYQAFFVPYRSDMKGFARYFSVCKSNQVSVSYYDSDHLLENVRRLYFLAPFLFLLSENSCAFSENKPFTGHQGMMYRSFLEQGRGGIPPYVFTAKSGEEFISNHIEHVMNNPLFVYYNEKGDMERLEEPGEWTNFLALEKQGLNIASNYYLAQSMLWPDVKIAALKNAEGDVTQHRFEARMFGVGIHQHQSAFLLVAGLAFDENFAQKTNELLSDFGFYMDDAAQSKSHLLDSYKNAQNHNGKFFDIKYGLNSMAEFASNFADIIAQAKIFKDFEDEISPLIDICKTGCTDSKVNSLVFPNIEDILHFQSQYPEKVFTNPCRTNKDVFQKELRELGMQCTNIPLAS